MGIDLDLSFGTWGEWDVKVPIDGAAYGFGPTNQIGVIDAEVGFGSSADVIFFQVKVPGGSQLGVLEGFRSVLSNLGVDPLPDGIKNADMRRNGFHRVSQDIDDAGIGKFIP